MTYYLTVSYDEDTDEFFSYVDTGPNDKTWAYVIETTEEMCALIQTGVMNHIDDVDGLHKFLVKQNIMKDDDTILINEMALP